MSIMLSNKTTALLQDLAEFISVTLEDHFERKISFILNIFEDCEGRYIGNTSKKAAIKALREIADKLENEQTMDINGPIGRA